MHVIGLDIGTTTLSAVVLDAKTGAVERALSEPNSYAQHSKDKWARTQDPQAILAACQRLLRSAGSASAAAIGLTGQMHGTVYIDDSGQAASPLFTWQDGRGDQPADSGETYAGRLSRLTGYSLATGFGSVTHYWHALRGAPPPDAVSICTIADYIGMRLCGRPRPLMHASNAASFGLFMPKACVFDRDALRCASIDPSIFPRVTSQTAMVGADTDGIPVSVAIGDNQASFLGSVRASQDSVLINVGTGSQISMMSNAAAGSDIESRPLSGDSAILVGSALCGGRAYALLEAFLRSCAELAGASPQSLYPAMNAAATVEEPSLTVQTTFAGTRAMPDARGSITGIGLTNFTASELISGTLHGIAEELHAMYQAMLAAGASPPRALIGSGNAIRKNPALRRVFERKFDMPLRIPAHEEEAAYGAALYAMAAAGITGSLQDAQALIRYQGE